jgi:endonuclease-3
MQKERYIQKVLNELFPEPAIPLAHKDPYTLLLAVLLSARCTDKRVNQVTPALFSLADTPEKMAQCDPKAVQAIIRPCGLSERKANDIVSLSQILVEHHGGKVPESFDALEALPGVGHKTASVVMAQAFHCPAFPVDTHIVRLARRWGFSKVKSRDAAERALKKAFPKESWITLHLQMIYYGRSYCPARGHVISECPICKWVSKQKASGRESIREEAVTQ